MNAVNNAKLPEPNRRLSLTATAAVVVGGRVYGMAVSLAAIAVVARVLSQDEFGKFAFALSLLYVSAALARFGFDRLVLKITAERLAFGDQAGYRLMQRSMYSCVFVTSLLVSLSLLAYSLLMPEQQSHGVWLALVVGCPVMAFTQVFAENFRGLGDPLRATLFDAMRTGPIVNSMFLILVVVTHTLGAQTLGVERVLGLFVGSHICLFFLALTQLLRYDLPQTAATQQPTGRRDLMKMAAPIAGTELVAVLTTNVDIWIATYFLTNRDVANLAVLVQFGQLVACPLTMASAAVSQSIAELIPRDSIAELQHTLRLAATLATIVAICVIVPIFLFGTQLLTMLYGAAYSGSAPLLMIHCGAKLVFTATGVAGLLLVLSSRQRLLLVVNVAFVAIFVVTGSLAAYFWQLGGLVIAGSLLVVAQNVLTCLLARRHTAIWTHSYPPTYLLSLNRMFRQPLSTHSQVR